MPMLVVDTASVVVVPGSTKSSEMAESVAKRDIVTSEEEATLTRPETHSVEPSSSQSRGSTPITPFSPDDVCDGDDDDAGQQAATPKGKASLAKRASSWKKNVTFNLANTYYTVIRDVIRDLGYTVGKDTDKKCMVIW